MNKNLFTLARDNDASPTIRGFVYQVNLTLLKWINLEDNQILELERGEDIDVITTFLNAQNGINSSRLLKQIKNCSDKITLNSLGAKKAIFDFYKHNLKNPEYDLQYQFITTQRIGKEQNLFFNNVTILSGIEVWERIRTRTKIDNRGIDNKQLKLLLSTLKNFLLQQSCPKKISKEEWNDWQKYLQKTSYKELKLFIQSFEWSCDNFNLSETETKVKLELVKQGLCNQENASPAYDHLFTYVFKKLSQKGIKQLNSKELLSEIDNIVFSNTSSVIQNLKDFEERIKIYSNKQTQIIIEEIRQHSNLAPAANLWLNSSEEKLEKFLPKQSLNDLIKFEKEINIELNDTIQAKISYLKGLCYDDMRMFDEADKCFMNAYTKQSNEIKYQEKILALYARENQKKEQSELLEIILSKNQFNPTAWAVKVFCDDAPLEKLEENIKNIPFLLKGNSIYEQEFKFTLSRLYVAPEKHHLALNIIFQQELQSIPKKEILTFNNKNYWTKVYDTIFVATFRKLGPVYMLRASDKLLKDKSFKVLINRQHEIFSFLGKDYVQNYLHHQHINHLHAKFLSTLDVKDALHLYDFYKSIDQKYTIKYVFGVATILSQAKCYKELTEIITDETCQKYIQLYILRYSAYYELENLSEAKKQLEKFLLSLDEIDEKPHSHLINYLGNFCKTNEERQNFIKKVVIKNKFVQNIAEYTCKENELSLEQRKQLLNECKQYIGDNNEYKVSLANEFYRIYLYQEAIQLLKNIVKIEEFSFELELYIRILIQSKLNDKQLLEYLAYWRQANYPIDYRFLGAEIDLLASIDDWKKVKKIAQLGYKTFPKESFFLYVLILSLSKLNEHKILEQLLNNNLEDINFSQHQAFQIIQIAIRKKRYKIALNICYKFAEDEYNEEARHAYFTIVNFKNFPKNIFTKYQSIEKGCYIVLQIGDKEKIIAFDKCNRRDRRKSLGKTVGQEIILQQNYSKATPKIIAILDKYDALYWKIQQEFLQNRSLFAQSFHAPKNITEFNKMLVKEFGQDGSLKEAHSNELFEKYYSLETGFAVLARFHHKFPLDFYNYLTSKNQENQDFKILPAVRLKDAVINLNSDFILDFTSLPLMMELTKELSDIHFKKRFYVTKSLIDVIEQELYLAENERESKLFINISLKGVVPIFYQEGHQEKRVTYLRNVLKWIDEYCTYRPIYEKVEVLGEIKREIAFGNNERMEAMMSDTFSDYLMDIAFLRDNPSMCVLSDDLFFYDFLKDKGGIITSELFLRNYFGLQYYEKNILPIFLKKNYFGLILSEDILIQEFENHIANLSDNRFMLCLKSISLYHSENGISTMLAINLLKRIYQKPLTLETKQKYSYLIFDSLLDKIPRNQNQKFYIHTLKMLKKEFRLRQDVIDFVIEDFNHSWKKYKID